MKQLIIIEKSQIQAVLQYAHGKLHNSTSFMLNVISDLGIHWNGVKRSCEDFIKDCVEC